MRKTSAVYFQKRPRFKCFLQSSNWCFTSWEHWSKRWCSACDSCLPCWNDRGVIMVAIQPMMCDTNLLVCTSLILTTDISGSREQKQLFHQLTRLKDWIIIHSRPCAPPGWRLPSASMTSALCCFGRNQHLENLEPGWSLSWSNKEWLEFKSSCLKDFLAS